MKNMEKERGGRRGANSQEWKAKRAGMEPLGQLNSNK
jgi:hypothetical protein